MGDNKEIYISCFIIPLYKYYIGLLLIDLSQTYTSYFQNYLRKGLDSDAFLNDKICNQNLTCPLEVVAAPKRHSQTQNDPFQSKIRAAHETNATVLLWPVRPCCCCCPPHKIILPTQLILLRNSLCTIYHTNAVTFVNCQS